MPVRLLGIGLPLTIALGALAAVASSRSSRSPRRVVLASPAGADRCRARPGGRHGAAGAVADPAGAQRRERAQRRHLRAAAVRRRSRSPTSSREISGGRSAGTLAAEEIGYGVARRRRRRAARRRDRHPGRSARPDRSRAWLQVIPVAGAALAYGIADALGGSGFIAAFVGGMTFGSALAARPGGARPAHRGDRPACWTASRSCSSARSCSGRRSTTLSWEHRPLRRAQPHRRADGPGRDRDDRARRATRRRSPSSAGSVRAAWRRSCSP